MYCTKFIRESIKVEWLLFSISLCRNISQSSGNTWRNSRQIGSTEVSVSLAYKSRASSTTSERVEIALETRFTRLLVSTFMPWSLAHRELVVALYDKLIKICRALVGEERRRKMLFVSYLF